MEAGTPGRRQKKKPRGFISISSLLPEVCAEHSLLQTSSPPGGLPNREMEPALLLSPALAGGSCHLRQVLRSLGSGRSPEAGHGNTFQYSCLENPMDKGAWWTWISWIKKPTVRRVAKSWTQLKPLSRHTSI